MELLKEQYDHLNNEILENSNKIYQVLNFCVAGTAALIVLGPKGELGKVPFGEAFAPFAALLPFAIILPSMKLVESSLHSTVRIATYLKVVYEKGSKPLWQTAVDLSRGDKTCPQQRRSGRSYQWVFRLLILVSVAISVSSFVWTVLEQVRGAQPVWPAWGLMAFVLLYAGSLLALGKYTHECLRSLHRTFDKSCFDEWERYWSGIVSERNASAAATAGESTTT